MDIRAWERRAEALDGDQAPYSGYQDEQDYYDETGELISADVYEEMLFRRVLDKIRIARAAGDADVQLSPEELDAYQSKLHGARSPTTCPQPTSRPSSTSLNNDTASVVSAHTTSRHGHSASRSKKSEKRTSLFGSKPKKEKERSSHRKRASIASSEVSQASPGFVIPGPDGQPIFAPINAYQGSLARDAVPAPAPASTPTYQSSTPPRASPPRGVLGAFPGSEHAYQPVIPQPVIPTRNGRPLSARQIAYEREHPPDFHTRSPSVHSTRTIPFPVELYQYQSFSPNSASPTSPQPHYAPRVSSSQSEASYTSMPRRVPVPVLTPAPLQRTVTGTSVHAAYPDPQQATSPGATVIAAEQPQVMGRASASGKDGERKRKNGRPKKKV